MTERSIRLHAFASTKGGVGKSTLAIAAAHWIAIKAGRGTPVVIDLDLTGSSLGDGLGLLAPNVETDDDGRFAFDAPAHGWLPYSETRRRRHERSRLSTGGGLSFLPYANDVLLANQATNVGSWLWRDDNDSPIRYLPSSSLAIDIERSTRVLVGTPGPDWRDALISTIVEIADAHPGVTDMILDLPPGTWGFAHAALAALRALEMTDYGGIDWSTNAILIASADWNALVPTLEYLVRNRRRLATEMRPVVNRSTETPERVRTRARQALDPVLAKLDPQNLLFFLDEIRDLRSVFRGGQVVPDALNIADVLRLR